MFSKEEIIENNKLIAIYLGYTYFPYNMPELQSDSAKSGKNVPGWKKDITVSNFNKFNQFDKELCGLEKPYLCRNHNDMLFDTDWNWLMRVVEKLEQEGYGIDITPQSCTVIEYLTGMEIKVCEIFKIDSPNKMERIYFCVVETIKYINKRKQILDWTLKNVKEF